MMCQACGRAPATTKDHQGRDVCGRAAHQALDQTKKGRKDATALSRYIKDQGEKEKPDSSFEKAKELLKEKLGL